MHIPFNRIYLTGHEMEYIQQACANNKLSGDGGFTHKCQTKLEELMNCRKALLTASCTAALEMAALLIDVQPGDEIIMPSYTFVSTANAFVLRGAVPVFVDIRADTLNIDESKIEAVITPKTKAIVPVHYAGVSCEMDRIMDIANRHSLYVIEDAAQTMLASYKAVALGTIGHLGAVSFHDTKNICAGEGGALIINDPKFNERAEIIREKGTNRTQFIRGQIDKYTWHDVGSSYLVSELNAAFLLAQLEAGTEITQRRLTAWNLYHAHLAELEASAVLRRPIIPEHCAHNAHMYPVLFKDAQTRDRVANHLKSQNIQAVAHYTPLHNSAFGSKCSRTVGALENTLKLSACILRLPLWVGLELDLNYFKRLRQELENILCEPALL